MSAFGGDRFLDATSDHSIMETKSPHIECPSCKAKWDAQCTYCKVPLKAAFYVCPECATLYCLRCAIAKSELKEPCPKCGKPLWPE